MAQLILQRRSDKSLLVRFREHSDGLNELYRLSGLNFLLEDPRNPSCSIWLALRRRIRDTAKRKKGKDPEQR